MSRSSNDNFDINNDYPRAMNRTIFRVLLDFHINNYNTTMRRIDALYDVLDDIRGNINRLVNLDNANQNSNPNSSQNSNQNSSQNSNPNSNQNSSQNSNQNIFAQSRYRDRGSNVRYTDNRRTNNRGRSNSNPNSYTNPSPLYILGRPYRVEYDHNARSSYFNYVPERNSNIRNSALDFLENFYSSIPIVPTRREIEQSTTANIFSEIENPRNTSCPITLEPFENDEMVRQINRCGHIFNTIALNEWFQTNVRCPVCRHDIRENDYQNPLRRTNDEAESKEEEKLEESKDDIPTSSSYINDHSARSESIRDMSNNITSALSELTESLIQQLFTRDNSNNNAQVVVNGATYDASLNEVIFTGYTYY
jgi:hypothetical protein